MSNDTETITIIDDTPLFFKDFIDGKNSIPPHMIYLINNLRNEKSDESYDYDELWKSIIEIHPDVEIGTSESLGIMWICKQQFAIKVLTIYVPWYRFRRRKRFKIKYDNLEQQLAEHLATII